MLAIIFDSVGAGEWLVLLAVLLIVMGPKRLPATARQIGAYYSKFRRAADNFKRQLMDMDLEMERELKKATEDIEDAVKIPDGDPFDEDSSDLGPSGGDQTDGDQPDQES